MRLASGSTLPNQRVWEAENFLRLAAIVSTMNHRPLPLLIGHRGSPARRIEHSRSSYLLAFAAGADAVEPDIVLSLDGVPVIRHENEISATTNVADRPEFANRKTTKVVDGEQLTGWFTEDFTWDELRTLRCRERIAETRPINARFNDTERLLRLGDLLELMAQHAPETLLVLELKHPTFYAAAGFDLAASMDAELQRFERTGHPVPKLLFESFELGVLDRLVKLGRTEPRVFLLESEGAPADTDEFSYAHYRTDEGLKSLVGRVAGVSVAKRDLFRRDGNHAALGTNDLVRRAHALGLQVFTWTLRPEAVFVEPGLTRSQEWQAILATEVDAIFCDDVELGRAAIQEFVSV